MKSSREHEDEGYLSVRESGESARLPAPQAAVMLLSTIVAEEAPTDTLNAEPARLRRRCRLPRARCQWQPGRPGQLRVPLVAIRACGSWQERRPLWDAAMSNMNIYVSMTSLGANIRGQPREHGVTPGVWLK